jgi:HAD superfamily hydrolase (TIGR01509 family)
VAFAAVIFDMDGVIVDSEPMHFATTNDVLRRRGVELSRDQYDPFLGLTETAFFERMVARWELTDTPAALAAERLALSLEALANEPLLPVEGALESLLWLMADGYKLGLASSATAEQVRLVIERLGLRRVFGAVVSAGDVVHGKPSPDLFLEAARRLGVAPGDCLVVEDAALGVQAARAAGMAALALVAPGVDESPHRRAGALACLGSMRELTPELLDELSARSCAEE